MLLPLIVWIWTCDMPAVPVVAAVAIDAAATEAATATLAAITTATFAASVTGGIIAGAVGGAIGGAISGAAFGGDPGMDALTGAISGGVGGGVGSELKGVSPVEAAAVRTGAGFATGTASNLLQGEKFGQALKGGAVSGLSSGIASGIGAELNNNSEQTAPSAAMIERAQGKFGALPFYPTDQTTTPPFDFSNFTSSLPSPDVINQNSSGSSILNKGAQSALSYGIKSGLNDVFGSNVPTAQPASSGFPSQPTSVSPPPSTASTPGTNGPNIDALAQALRSVGDLGYSPGGPVFGSQNSGPQRKVWNKASLRVTDDQNQ